MSKEFEEHIQEGDEIITFDGVKINKSQLRRIAKKERDKLIVQIEDAIDAYIQAGCKDFFFTRNVYDLGYEVKLSIRKVKKQ